MPWIDACATDDIDEEDLIRFDHEDRTFAIYHSPDGDYFCTDGLCTHEQVHLEDGLVPLIAPSSSRTHSPVLSRNQTRASSR